MPKITCMIPVRTVAAKRYCKPWSLTKSIISNAIAPVAAEIDPGLPPKKAVRTAIIKEVYSPTLGSTPAIIEKAIASGISANPTTAPANKSCLVLKNHCLLRVFKFNTSSVRFKIVSYNTYLSVTRVFILPKSLLISLSQIV